MLQKERLNALARLWLSGVTVLTVCLSFVQAQTFSISGRVFDTEGRPLPGVSVSIHETAGGVFSDSTGFYRLTNLKAGVYHLHVEALERRAVGQTVVVTADVFNLNFSLAETHIETQRVLIEADPFKSDARERSLSMERIDAADIQKHLGYNFVDALMRTPGLNAMRMGVGVAKPVIRGLSFNRVLVIDQGIKQEGQQWAADHGLEIDVFNVERVEILKGPASLMFGSDAIGGVLQIKPPPEPEAGSLSVSLKTAYMSLNQNFSGSAAVNGANKGTFFRVRFSWQDYGDYSVPAKQFNYNRYLLPILNNLLKNTAGKERNASLTWGIRRKWGNWRLTGTLFHQTSGMFAGAIGVPRAYQLADDGDRRNIDLPSLRTIHARVVSNAHILLGKNWLEIDAGFQYNDRQENSIPHAHGRGPTPKGTEEHRLFLRTASINARYHIRHSRRWDGVAGVNGQMQNNTRGGYEFVLPDFTAANGGVFIHEKYKLTEKIFINGGLRFDWGGLHISRFADSLYNGASAYLFERNAEIRRNYQNLAGSLGVSYNPIETFNFKFNFGTDFRYPTAAELSANGVHHGSFRHERGDPDLQPERGYQFDFAASYEAKKVLIKFSPFLNFFENYIYLRPAAQYSFLPEGGQIYQYTQAPALHTGGEATLEFHPLKNLHAAATGAYVYAKNRIDDLPLPFIPPATGRVEIEYVFPKIGRYVRDFSIMADMQAVANQTRVVRNELPTPGYTIYNLTLGLKLDFGQKFPVSFNAQIVNLTDRYYMNHLSRYRLLWLPEPGRNITFTLAFGFEKKSS